MFGQVIRVDISVDISIFSWRRKPNQLEQRTTSMLVWKRPKLEEAYCKECGERFCKARHARIHARKTGHKVVIKWR